jgi:hypothetical protein
MRMFANDWKDAHWGGFGQFDPSNQSLEKLRDRDMVSLISHFRYKECSVPRDQVFSLLSLSVDGARVDVDYESPAVDLAVQLLSLCPQKLCVCSSAVVAKSLGLAANSSELCLEIDIAGLCLAKNVLRNTSAWHENEPLYCLTHPITSTTWAYDSYVASKIPLPRCLENTFGYFSRAILQDETIAEKCTRLYDPMQVLPLSELLSQYPSKRKDWYLLRDDPCQIVVSDPERNLCTMRMSLQAASRVLYETMELCPNPKPWYQDDYDGVVRAIRLVGHKVHGTIIHPKTPTPLPT